MQAISNLLLYWAALVGIASAIFHMTGPWWTSPMGRHLAAYMWALALVLCLVGIRNLLGPFPGYQVMRIVVFAAIPIVMTRQLWLQIKFRYLNVRIIHERIASMTNPADDAASATTHAHEGFGEESDDADVREVVEANTKEGSDGDLGHDR